MCVAQNLEGLEESMGPVAHDGDMRLPVKAEMKEEAQVAYHRFRGDPVVRVGSLIHEVQAIRGGIVTDTRGTKIDELCLGRFRGKVVAEKPFVTEAILVLKESVHLRPRGSAGKDDPIVNVHAQSGLRGRLKAGEEGGRVEGGQDEGKGGALGRANGLVAKGAHLAIEGQVDVAIREEGQGPTTHARGEAKVHEDGRKAILVHIVEEALDVEHEGSAVQAAAMRNMDIVEEGEAGIQRAREGASAELGGGDKAMCVDAVKEAL